MQMQMPKMVSLHLLSSFLISLYSIELNAIAILTVMLI